jgi:hypothetical protein
VTKVILSEHISGHGMDKEVNFLPQLGIYRQSWFDIGHKNFVFLLMLKNFSDHKFDSHCPDLD